MSAQPHGHGTFHSACTTLWDLPQCTTSSGVTESSLSDSYTVKSSSITPGIGSVPGKRFSLGKWQLHVLKNIIIRRKLAKFKRLFSYNDGSTSGSPGNVYHYVLELTRHGQHSEPIRKEAFGFLLSQIASGNTACLVDVLEKWPSSTFITEIRACIPSQTTRPVPSRQDMHADLWQNFYLPFTKKGCIITPLLRFLGELAQKSVAYREEIVNAGFLDNLLHLYFQNFHFLCDVGTILLNGDDPNSLKDTCKTLDRILAKAPLYIAESFERLRGSPRAAKATPQHRSSYDCEREDSTRAKLLELQRLFDDASVEGRVDAYSEVLKMTGPGRYSDEIRQQALAMVFPQIATGNIADLIKAFANKPSAEVEEFVTECIACLPTEWLIVDLRPSRQRMHADLWKTSYLTFVEPGRIATSFVTFFLKLAKSSPRFGQILLQAGFFNVLADFEVRKYCLPLVSVPYSPRYGDPKQLQDACKSTMKIFKTCRFRDGNVALAVQNHPLHTLWYDTGAPFLFVRRAVWTCDPEFIPMRLGGIQNTIDFLSNSLDYRPAMHATIDILEFAASDTSDLETFDKALNLLKRWIEQYPKEMSSTIRIFLESDYDGIVELVSNFFHQVLRRTEVLLSTDIEARIGILLACFLAAATNNPISQQVLIDAGLRLPDDLFCDSWQSYIVRVDAMKLSRHTSNSTKHISNAILQQTRAALDARFEISWL